MFAKILKNPFFQILVIALFTISVVYLATKNYINEMIDLVLNVNLMWMGVILVAMFFYHAIVGWILMILTRISNPHYRLRQGILNAFVAAFFHGITPSASGGQIAQVYIFRKQGVVISDAASILWMDFIIYQMTMVSTVFMLLILRFKYFFNNHSQLFGLVLIGFLINGAIIFGLWSLAQLPKFHHWVFTRGINIAVKLRIIKKPDRLKSSIQAQVERFQQEKSKLVNQPLLIVKMVLANLVRLLLFYSIPLIAMASLDISISPYSGIDVLALTAFVSMISAFVPIPGASGGTEATFILMFSTIVGLAQAGGTMIIWRFATYYLIMIVGGVIFIIYKQLIKEL